MDSFISDDSYGSYKNVVYNYVTPEIGKMYMQTVLAVLIELCRGEINGLKYSDVDYINQTLKVQRQLGKKTNAKKKNCE